MTSSAVRVLVVDDHELVRTGLRGVLANDPAIDVVAEAADGLQALAAVEVHHPDVVVMDLQMPGMGGIDATRRIVAARPGTAVLVLTMFDDDDSVYAALRAGARGYLLKGAGRDELRAAVVGAAVGNAVFGPGIAARVLDRMVTQPQPDETFPDLTPREREVLERLVDGLQPVAIGQRLGISEKTVRNTISSVLTKLHVADRTAAIDSARRAGMRSRTSPQARVVMFTEIDGPSVLARDAPDAFPAIVAEHNKVVDAVVSAEGGTRFGLAGDARFAWFSDANAAVRASIEAHRRLAAHGFPAGAVVRVRIGIHRGALAEQGDDAVGLVVHETARVAGAGAGGETVITEQALPGEGIADITYVDMGETELLGLDRPLRLFRVLAAGGEPVRK